MQLALKGLSFGYDKKDLVLRQLELAFEPMLTVVVGPNGAGKSTLIKCMAGVLDAGPALQMDGLPVAGAAAGSRARYIQALSYLPQYSHHPAAITVLEAVLLGLLHSLTLNVSDDSLDQAMQTLEELGIAGLAEKKLHALSGGQQQLVGLAQAIVKRPRILLLDEPLNNLDIHHQLELLELLKRLTKQRGMITVMTLHDLNFAARYADRVIVLHEGAVFDKGRPADVFSREMIRDVYRVEAELILDEGGVPRMYFLHPQSGPVIQVPE